MTTLAIALGSLILYLIAYNTYGKWLGGKIFKLSKDALVPAVELEDGNDFVPTKKGVVFGHHFTSIAGTGPIVGPAVAVMWGWLPALFWVLFGSIFIGAVHDFGALVVSMRNKGQTVGEIAGHVISPRVRLLFLLILFLALTIVLAIFGLVIASVFRLYPSSISPCLLQVPLAVAIGFWCHRHSKSIFLPSLLTLGLMYLSVAYADTAFFSSINSTLAALPLMAWVSLLLVYSYIASILPVWSLLQPRDYINSLQLISALALLVIGMVVAGLVGVDLGGNVGHHSLEIIAPAVEEQASAKHLPLIFPFLFVTIACGAISGFHCLVSSGTSSKQLRCETDAQFVGFGSMLTEGFLAVLVILACVAGLGLGMTQGETTVFGKEAWDASYADFSKTNSLPAKLDAFVQGSANFLRALHLPASFALTLMGVFVASFAATTLDTACRLQRYVLQELVGVCFRNNQSQELSKSNTLYRLLSDKHTVTIFAIVIAYWLAYLPAAPGHPNGTGGVILWPLFGAINQLLGGLAFLVIYFWMKRQQLATWFLLIPALFMLILPAWAMLHQIFIQAVGSQQSWIGQEKWLLVGIGAATLVLECWMIVEACSVIKKQRL